MATKHGLGRGLDALIQDAAAQSSAPARSGVLRIPVDRIRRSPWQPRRSFEQEALAELARSIREHGVLQPLLVRPSGDGYELIAGERRLRAAAEAGLKDVPVVVMTAADNDSALLTLVENLQREDLNPLEEAEGYRMLAERFNMTQEQIADRVAKSRPAVANALRLLDLPEEVRKLIASGDLSAGHAKALLGLTMPGEQILLAHRAVKDGLSVRDVERLVKRAAGPGRRKKVSRDDIPEQHMAHLSDRLHQHFGTSIRLYSSRTLANGRKVKGCLEIDFYSPEELTRILEIMGVRIE